MVGFVAVLLVGCRGDELGRVELPTDPSKPITVETALPAGTRVVSLDYDATWDGNEKFQAGTLELQLLDPGKNVVATKRCPTNPNEVTKVCSRSRSKSTGTTNEACEMAFGCTLDAATAARSDLTLKATLAFDAPKFTSLNKLGLVFRAE